MDTEAPKAGERAKPGGDGAEFFERSCYFASQLRNWYIAYGVGGILLLARTTEVTLKDRATPARLFLAGLAAQVLLALVNKVITYYVYRGTPPGRDTAWKRYLVWVYKTSVSLCDAFWIDIVTDSATFLLYAGATWILLRQL